MDIVNNTRKLFQSRIYMCLVIVAALAGYGYEITHCSYGVDDVIYDWYIYSGKLVSMGRFTPWLINKFFRISMFSPFIVDFLGVVLLIIAGTILCGLFQSILSNKSIDVWVYSVFTSLLLVYPMNGEVYIYYMHNAIGIAFLMTSISMCLLYENFYADRFGKIRNTIISIVLIMLANSCYESFAIVVATIAGLIVLLEAYNGNKITIADHGKWFINVGIVLVISMLMRSVITKILCAYKNLDVYQTSGGTIGWQFSNEAGEIWRTLKAQLLGNYLYYGTGLFMIKLMVLAFAALLVISCVMTIKQKNIYPLLIAILLLMGQFSISILTGTMQLYRMNQSIVVLVAFIIFFLCIIISNLQNNILGKTITAIIGLIVVYNSAVHINQLFVFEYNMSERCADKVKQIGQELEAYDLTDKKVVFLGSYSRSKEENNYLNITIGEKGYSFLNWIDINVYNYDPEFVAQGRSYKIETVTDGDVLSWSVNAYNEHNWATQKLFEHYGYDFQIVETVDEYNYVNELYNNSYAENNQEITQIDNYLIVNLR